MLKSFVISGSKGVLLAVILTGFWGSSLPCSAAEMASGWDLMSRGQEFARHAQAGDIAAARAVFKRAMKSIQESPTPLVRLEQWFQKQPRFATMLGEAYTVAVAIAAAEVFLHHGEHGLSAKDVLSTVGMSVGIVGGVYLPYRIATDYLENRKNKRLLQQFLAGIESVMPLPESPERLSAWLVEMAGASPSSQFCARLLNP